MRLLSVLVLSSCLAGCLSSAKTDPAFTLNLIHINDTHSQFDASPASVDLNSDTLYTYIGGHPRLLKQANTLREQSKSANIPALFLHGGDAFKGSAYFELYEERINIDILNKMNIDAMALGNHEFDIGLEKLAHFVDKVNFPILAANIDASKEPLLSHHTNLKPFSLFVLEGNQLVAIKGNTAPKNKAVVAVLGVALEDMKNIATDTGNIVFYNEAQSTQRTVDALKAQGVKYIIALTHLGYQRDVALAEAVNGLDAIVGGHSHSLLGDFRHWALGKQPPYAKLYTNADGQGKTCVVQAGQFAQAVGLATLSFNKKGEVLLCEGQNTLLASKDFFKTALRDEASRIDANIQQQTEQAVSSLPHTAIVDEDSALRTHINQTYLPYVQQAYGKAISVTNDKVNHVRLPGSSGSDKHGSELAGHIADAMLYWANLPHVQQVSGKKADFALIGAGNIRAPLEAGTVYEGNIRLEVLPFNAPLSLVTLKGSDVKVLLEQTIGATLKPGAHSGKYPYSGALRYVAEKVADEQARLSAIEVLKEGSWTLLEDNQDYTLVTTSYLADGNDGWYHLQHVQQNQSDRTDVVLHNRMPESYKVNKVLATKDASGMSSYKAVYQGVSELPCDETRDCKVAAEAFIDYLIQHPMLWQQKREATVTLILP